MLLRELARSSLIFCGSETPTLSFRRYISIEDDQSGDESRQSFPVMPRFGLTIVVDTQIVVKTTLGL